MDSDSVLLLLHHGRANQILGSLGLSRSMVLSRPRETATFAAWLTSVSVYMARLIIFSAKFADTGVC